MKTPKLKRVRVCKEGGHVISFHERATPSMRGTLLVKRILLEHRVWHSLRCVHIHLKNTKEYRRRGKLLRREHATESEQV